MIFITAFYRFMFFFSFELCDLDHAVRKYGENFLHSGLEVLHTVRRKIHIDHFSAHIFTFIQLAHKSKKRKR